MIYRGGEGLLPCQIRVTTFAARRRGLDPEQVYAFLGRVADELTRLHRELAPAETEAERIKQGLRQWQARQDGGRAAERARPDRSAEPGWPVRINRGSW